jgi:hypothetical protein
MQRVREEHFLRCYEKKKTLKEQKDKQDKNDKQDNKDKQLDKKDKELLKLPPILKINSSSKMFISKAAKKMIPRVIWPLRKKGV